MEIKIDEGALKETIQESVKSAIIEGMQGWELKDSIGKVAAEAIKTANLPAKVEECLRDVLSVEIDDIVSEAVRTAMPGIRSAVGATIKQMAALMVMGLLKGKPTSEYDGLPLYKEAVAKVNAGRDAINGQ